jgi:hypothetical protein
MSLRPTQGDENRPPSEAAFHRKVVLSFVIPSEAKGSAVPRTFPGNIFRQSGGICSAPVQVTKILVKAATPSSVFPQVPAYRGPSGRSYEVLS